MTTRPAAVSSLPFPGQEQDPWSGRRTVWSQGTARMGGDTRTPPKQMYGCACPSLHPSPHLTLCHHHD